MGLEEEERNNKGVFELEFLLFMYGSKFFLTIIMIGNALK